jgi:hypothetical protein
MSGQLHVPVAFPTGKQPPVPTGQEAGWAPGPVWTLWRQTNLTPPGNRTPVAQPIARRYTD